MNIRATTTSRPANLRPITLAASIVSAAVLIVAGATPALAGPEPDRPARAGWTCFEHLEAWHCGPKVDELLAGDEPSTVTMLTWGLDDQGEPDEFWGTELLVHDAVYAGQPCPQDPLRILGDGSPGAYIDVAELGVPMPYVVCHRFDSPNT